MDLHIKSTFECVYLINGVLFERVDSLAVSDADVVYITVFPLKHSLLPYTVKLAGMQNASDELYSGVRLGDGDYLLSLSPRYMTVYSIAPPPHPPVSPINRLFSLVKKGDLDGAYAMLSDELKSTLDRTDLGDFFAGYERLEECDWTKTYPTRFYLINKNGAAKCHSYTLKDEFIDNIIELDE